MGLLSICQKTKKIGQGVSSELTIHAYALQLIVVDKKNTIKTIGLIMTNKLLVIFSLSYLFNFLHKIFKRQFL